MSDDRTEARLLLAVLRERWDEVDVICRRDGPDPTRFLSTARACDVLPQVHAALDGAGRLSFLGEGPEGRLSAARKKCRMDNLLLLARVERALDVLLAADVVPVVLKGAAVLHQFDVGFDSRTLDDVDLLVSHDDFERCVETLRAAGWTDSAELEPARCGPATAPRSTRSSPGRFRSRWRAAKRYGSRATTRRPTCCFTTSSTTSTGD
jgi:hypothetical protein